MALEESVSLFKCQHCKKDIEVHEKYYSINITKEVFEDGAVTVLDDERAIQFCIECGELYDLFAARAPLKRMRFSQE